MQTPRWKNGAMVAAAIGLMMPGCGEGPQENSPVPRVEAKKAAPSVEAFLRSAVQGDVAALEAGIAAGADVHASTAEGATALMLAAFEGHTAAVRKLLELGARIDHLDLSGRTALMYASSGPFVETVELLLDKGAQVNLTDGVEHWSALMFAAGEGLTGVIELLLSHEADANLQDVDGDTALAFAQRNGHEAAAVLLKAAMKE